MNDLVQFIVEDQEFVWWILGFFVLIYFIRFFIIITRAVFDSRRTLRIKGKL